MLYVYLQPNESVIFYSMEGVPERIREHLIEVESLPEGEGILRQAEDGSMYYEPYPEPVAPSEPMQPLSLIEEMHLEQLYQTSLLEMSLF